MASTCMPLRATAATQALAHHAEIGLGEGVAQVCHHGHEATL